MGSVTGYSDIFIFTILYYTMVINVVRIIGIN